MSYLYEMHLHTSEVSTCAKVSAAESVKLYHENGYSGCVVTDHFHKDRFRSLKSNSWKEYVDSFLKGYHIALENAPDGFNVFLGLELRFPENDNDYLVYGVNEELLYNNEFFYDSDPQQFKFFADKNNLLFFQAHPFRNYMQIVKPSYLHGIEVANYNQRHDSRNDTANNWADKFSLLKISGSDFHEMEDLALGGIYAQKEINSIEEMVELLKSGQYELKL